MRLVWSRSEVVGDLICWGTDSPVSHFAIEFHECLILQSNFFGVGMKHIDDFTKHSKIIYSKDIQLTFHEEAVLLSNILKNYYGKRYDWKWFFNLIKAALKYKLFGVPIPNEAMSKSRDKFLCTECVEFLEPIIGKVDVGNGSPYLLAKKLLPLD